MDFLERFSAWLNGRPWLSAVSLLISVVSVVLAAFYHSRAKRERRPVYLLKGFPLVRGQLTQIPGIRILFGEQPIDNLTVTHIALWNRGREPINASDVSSADPLRIEVHEPAHLLGARIVHSTTPQNCFALTTSPEKGSVSVQFDYFQHNQGIVAEVYHTGLGSKDVKLVGTIKGSSELMTFDPDHPYAYLAAEFLGSPIRRLGGDKAYTFPSAFLAVPYLILIALPLVLPFFLLDLLVVPFRTTPKVFLLQDQQASSALGKVSKPD